MQDEPLLEQARAAAYRLPGQIPCCSHRALLSKRKLGMWPQTVAAAIRRAAQAASRETTVTAL